MSRIDLAETGGRFKDSYDLIPQPVVSQDRRDLAMKCGRSGRFANVANLLSEHPRSLLGRGEAEKIVYGMQEQVEKTWHKTVLANGVSTKNAETIQEAFAYPGFSRI